MIGAVLNGWGHVELCAGGDVAESRKEANQEHAGGRLGKAEARETSRDGGASKYLDDIHQVNVE